MRRILTLATALTCMSAAVTTANAQIQAPELADCCCQQDVCCSGGWFADVEVLFMRFHQSGGVRNFDEYEQPDYNAEFDFENTARITIGYECCDGLGVRASYWDFDHTAPTFDGGFVNIDTHTLDFEVFQGVCLSDCLDLEVFAGVRSLGWQIADNNDVDLEFDGIGLLIGTEFSRYVGCGQRIYARTTAGIVVGDTIVRDGGRIVPSPQEFIDVESMLLELSVGWEACKPCCCGTLVYGVGAELRHWSDLAIAGDDDLNINSYDVGFAGFTGRIGIRY